LWGKGRGGGLFFVGEAPGADEDRLGEPFVGRAGKKLDEAFAAVGLTRDEVYIANALKCRPKNNKLPEDVVDCLRACLPYLHLELRLRKPAVVVILGATAARLVTPNYAKPSVRLLRGEWIERAPIPTLVTYHPAYLLRAKRNETKLFLRDLQAAKKMLDKSRNGR